MRRRYLPLWVSLFALLGLSKGHASDYALDDVSRVLSPGQPLPCRSDALDLVVYRGTTLRYQKPLRVHRAFVPQLQAFEQIAARLSRETYGREPRRVVHLGSYNCRTMRRYPEWVSEHALGNALDLAGFDFARAPRSAELPDGAPSTLRRALRVRMETHWNGRRGEQAVHARFLRTLAQRLIERPDVFSVVLGPAWPGHHNHLHLDRAPYRVVEVFDEPTDERAP